MTLWTKAGCYPQPLPASDERLSDGFLLMPLDGHPESIEACGWAEAPRPPAFDPATQQLGWDGAAWTVAPLSAAQLKDRLDTARATALAALAAVRWDRQQEFIYQGDIALSDDITIGRVIAKVVSAQVAGTTPPPTKWKFAPGRFADVTIADLVAYGQAIGVHVQSCFDREAALTAQIAAATTVAAIGAIDIQAGWPA